MRILRDAADAVQRNLSALLLYLAVNGALAVVYLLLNAAVRLRYPEDGESMAPALIDLLFLLLLAGVMAVLQAVVFSRMGREIDKPLWKVRDDRDAIRRFYMLWLTASLGLGALQWLGTLDYGDGDQTAINSLFFLLFFLGFLVYIPCCACIMFFGHVSWDTLGQALEPLIRHAGRALPILLVPLFQFALLFYVNVHRALEGDQVDLVKWLPILLATSVALSYFDCIIFAATWLVCIYNRETPDEIDLDF